MESHELRRLLDVALADKSVETFMRNLSFVVSYLISEQDKRAELARKLEEHTKRMAEYEKDSMKLSNKLEAMAERSEANGKMLRNVLVAVVSGILLEVVKLFFKK